MLLPPNPTWGLHQAIYSMYVHGEPTRQLERAQQLEPDATRMVCRRWPGTVGREAKWLRCRHLIMCARRPEAVTTRLWQGLIRMPCLLRLVVTFL